MNIWHIAELTFQEALRRKALIAALGLTLLFLALYAVGVYYAFLDIGQRASGPSIVRVVATSELLLAGLFTVANIGALLAIFMAAGAIAPEIEEGTLHAIAPKPVRRWEIVLGKWLGNSLMISGYVAVTGVILCAIIYALSGYFPQQLVVGLALIALKAIMLLSVALLGSTVLPALAAGIIAFILYTVSSTGGMVEQLGRLMNNQTLIDIGIVTSLLIPADALWKMGAAALQPTSLTELSPAALYGPYSGPFSVTSPPSIWMAVYALAYLVVTVLSAIALFTRRDL